MWPFFPQHPNRMLPRSRKRPGVPAKTSRRGRADALAACHLEGAKGHVTKAPNPRGAPYLPVSDLVVGPSVALRLKQNPTFHREKSARVTASARLVEAT
jgi:hypothetical protein